MWFGCKKRPVAEIADPVGKCELSDQHGDGLTIRPSRIFCMRGGK